MKYIRKSIFWAHLLAGVFAGIVVLIMSVTGVLLTYERQIVYWADTRGYTVTPPATSTDGASQRLPIETLIAKVSEGQSSAPTTVTLREDRSAPASFSFAGGRMIFANPYTGEILGEGSKKTREFFQVVTNWHRWLGASGENRATARGVTGACNLAFLFLVVSGFYLWWPKSWKWTSIRNISWFRRGLSGKTRDFNWHNVIGFWSCVPLFIVVLSGVVISYTWAGNLVYRIVGETPPVQQRPAAPPAASQPNQTGGAENKNMDAPLAGLNNHWAKAAQQTSDWQIISLRMPTSADAPLTFTIDAGDGGQPHKRGQLTIDRATGEVVKWEPFSSSTRGRQLRSILRFAHTGEVAGLLGQTIAGIVSAGAAVLVWTGLALAWRRLRAWQARKRTQKVPVPIAVPVLEGATDVSQ